MRIVFFKKFQIAGLLKVLTAYLGAKINPMPIRRKKFFFFLLASLSATYCLNLLCCGRSTKGIFFQQRIAVPMVQKPESYYHKLHNEHRDSLLRKQAMSADSPVLLQTQK